MGHETLPGKSNSKPLLSQDWLWCMHNVLAHLIIVEPGFGISQICRVPIDNEVPSSQIFNDKHSVPSAVSFIPSPHPTCESVSGPLPRIQMKPGRGDIPAGWERHHRPSVQHRVSSV